MHTSTRYGRRKNTRWSDHGVIQLRDEIRRTSEREVPDVNCENTTRIVKKKNRCNLYEYLYAGYGRRKTVVLGVRRLKSVALFASIWRLTWREIIWSRGPKPKADSATARVRNMPRHFFWNTGGMKSGISIKIWKGTRCVSQRTKFLKEFNVKWIFSHENHNSFKKIGFFLTLCNQT